LGGNWQPDGPASKMYASAHLISSRNNTQFTDYKMPLTYPAYPNHTLFFEYLQNLASDFNLHAAARLNTTVTNMQKTEAGWQLTFQDGTSQDYAFVVVANGLLRKPIFPTVYSDYKGESLHSSEYKNSDIFKDKRVLIVGAGNSGCDIAVDATHTAKKGFSFYASWLPLYAKVH
jgi:cation diffusion facilitator CzcD-associated flavoprotein CzcO